MKTYERKIGEHVASVIKSRDEIRVAHLYEGVQVLIYNGKEYSQVLPESYGEYNQKGIYGTVQEGLHDCNLLLKDTVWQRYRDAVAAGQGEKQ